ncbi:MAG: thiamine-monophosphate kinase [Candidatus Dormibacteraeota bacterium]|nr:thiamine-monophosphate kinase [Candidatus Dormibacteraeota bacterium]
MDELELFARLRPHLAPAGGSLVIGAGEDDAAVWREPDGSYTVATCDTSVEGVHFDLAVQQPEDAGWRALCFALGDLAAKGARPAFGLAALSMPRRWPPEVAVGLYRGLAELAAEVGLRLVGGDTTRAPHDGSLTLSLLGSTWARPVPRAGVRPGWWIGVTGPVGGATPTWRRPRPRLELGARLAAAGLACGDISDGLLRELDKFAAASGAGARLLLDQVPCAPGIAPLDAIASGEEVELVCCGPAPAPSGLTVVGEVTTHPEVMVVDGQGRRALIERRGYDHFG